jgi:hypothetical protein
MALLLLLLIIVKKAIEKTGVRARTLRRDKPGAFAQTRTMHAVWSRYCCFYSSGII